MSSLAKVKFDDPLILVQMSRAGIPYATFHNFVERSSLTLRQWSKCLHLTERTIQRYRKEDHPFDTVHSERILRIAQLLKRGKEVFEDEAMFHIWLQSSIVSLGNVKPIDLLDSSFGIELIMDELGRIEHGILA